MIYLLKNQLIKKSYHIGHGLDWYLHLLNEIEPNYVKKIEKIYYNKETLSLVIVIDEKFQSSEEKRLKNFKKKERERKSKEEEHLQKQQKEISARISKLLD